MLSETHSTLFIVDDDASVRKGVGRFLRSAGFSTKLFASSQEFLEYERSDGPSCLVLDVQMPGLNGLELQEEMAARGISIPIIFITGHGDIPMTVKAMKSGAIDFLPKPFEDEMLLSSIDKALEKDLRDRRKQDEKGSILGRLDKLTKRERQVFDLVITGLLNKQIAGELGAAVKTIKVHRGRVMRKMEVVSVAELVHLAEQARVYPDPSAV